MKSIFELVKHPVRMVLSHIAPKTLAGIYYRRVSHKSLDWKNPQDLNEVINWQKFYGDTSMWPLFADKYRVREYIEEKGLGHTLVKLYGVWEDARDIDFDTLPDSFVLKTNHASGTNIIVKDKSTLTPLHVENIKSQLNNWLKHQFGQETVEFHYLKIKPVIIAEEFLQDEENTFSSSLVDYKVWCLNGRVFCICTYFNRTPHTVCKNVFDTNWNLMSDVQVLTSQFILGDTVVSKPGCMEQLIEYAERLSAGHPQMRVDFYIIKNKIYFGEITMTSHGGYMDNFTPEFLLKMGQEARKGIKL